MKKAIRVPLHIGIGDAVQFTSLPENYFRATGLKLLDWEHHWVFDHNPYVDRDSSIRDVSPYGEPIDLWNFYILDVVKEHKGRTVFLSNAETHCRYFDIPVVLNRPRLYEFESFPFYERKLILLHVKGKSHGQMPEKIVKHVLGKYGYDNVSWVGLDSDWDYSIRPPTYIPTPNTWRLAHVISRARMFIGVDSGPAWISRCYPDVVTKIVRLWPSEEELRDWVPLEVCRNGSHWDDRSAMIHNPFEDDAGFTWSYKRL